MQSRDIGVFALGFAAGAVVLGVLLLGSGKLHPSNTPHNTAAVASTPAAPPAIPGPAMPPPNLGSFRAPALPHAPLPSAAGEADRASPGRSASLAIPIPGIALDKLRDTFAESRGDHKHEALDIPAPRGTPVMAAVQGNVAKLFTSKQGGLTVYQFDDSGTYCYYYAHLDRYAPSLKEGTLLRRGDVLGYVGTTGDAPPNAPHLHFAVFRLGPEKKWWHGTAIDPLPLLKGE
jgi:peptidoglycan LD-endopeptidase LytH